MNKEWQKKLAGLGFFDRFPENPGVPGESDVPPKIGSIEELASPALVELSTLSVLDIAGEDAQTFFQDQVCNDLSTLHEVELQINGYCNPKGRLLAVFTVFAHEQGYRLILPADVAPAFTKRLQMFIMRAKVTIELRDDLVCSGIVLDAKSGNKDLADIAVLPNTELGVMGMASKGSVQLLRWHDSQTVFDQVTEQATQLRYLCIGSPSDLFTLWESDRFKHASWSHWRWLDINAGIPSVFNASVEQFIPQMLNMQHIDALSFKKGCYPGQEIVARMQYLGKLKKHMKHLRLPGATQAPLPAEVLVTDANNNAGQVVDAVLDEQGLNLLAVVAIDTPVSDIKLYGEALHEVPLPYSVTSESECGS